ncbi:MAG: DUF2163 domain-containing protein [Desulfobacteraceae bacterium]|nr:DUF2163 domain-containing protein [Desulfobacteraceae bacterium]
MSVTTYTNCLRIERTDGYVICLTELDKDLTISDSELDLSGGDQVYLSAAGYTPTNMQQTSDNAVNNADVEGVLSSIGVKREDIIGGRYDFAKLHIFIWDFENATLIKKLGSGHWGEVTLKDGSYVAEFRSLSQQLQQTIGRTYNPECDEQLGGTRCQIALGLFPKPDGKITAETTKNTFVDSSLIKEDDYWNGAVLTWTSGLNDTVVTLVDSYTLSTNTITILPAMTEYISKTDSYSLEKTFTGAATEDGTTNTFTDSNRTEGNNNFVGLTITFTSGLNNTETRTITDYTANVFTLDSALTNIVADTDTYEIDDTKNGAVTGNGASKIEVTDTSIGATDYSGMYLEFTSGLNNGDFRGISTSVSGLITLNSPFDNFILEDDEYTIINMTGETYMSLGEVTSVTDSQNFTATLTDDGTFGDDYFNYGKLTFTSGLNDNIHMEVKDFTESTNTFKLFLPMPFQIEVGDNFQVFAGCDKRLTTCKTKFNNNHVNFQGFPYIPGTDQISKFGGQ